MNIFYLDPNPHVCATYHVDSHVRKMILETAQMLSTFDRYHPPVKYPRSVPSHPCTKWIGESRANYHWTYDLLCELADEFQYRFGKPHAYKTNGTIDKLFVCPFHIPDVPFTSPYLAMEWVYKRKTPVESYRCYYKHGKKRLHKWAYRPVPDWIQP